MLLEDLTIENIPEQLGGKFTLYNESFTFDRSVEGPLYCAGCPTENANTTMGDTVNGPGNNSNCNNGSVARSTQQLEAPAEMIRHVFTRPEPVATPTFLQSFTLYSLFYMLCNFMGSKPLKALLVALVVGLFVFLRESGLLQYLVYPIVLYVYIFSTKPVVASVCTFFNIGSRFWALL